MNGVILFADDQVFASDSAFEKRLFDSLIKESTHPVVGVNSIDLLEKSFCSISTFKALILDWDFGKDFSDQDEYLDLPTDDPSSFLEENDIYSLIYIYSNKQIKDSEPGIRLARKYKNRITFLVKGNDVEVEKRRILDGIVDFEKKHPNLEVPFIWSQAINKSVQKIFRELETANTFWLKEIYNNALQDGGDACLEVLQIFDGLLCEQIGQDLKLINTVKEAVKIDVINTDPDAIVRLYHRLYYTKISNDSPIMTGDIFRISDDKSAILITPECQIAGKKEKNLEFLVVDRLESVDKFPVAKSNAGKFSKNEKKKALECFNQNMDKLHFLSSFPFGDIEYNNIALIDFNHSLRIISSDEFKLYNRFYKLNAPYINQLRQRFLSYNGRYGVPAIPATLKEYNLSNLES